MTQVLYDFAEQIGVDPPAVFMQLYGVDGMWHWSHYVKTGQLPEEVREHCERELKLKEVDSRQMEFAL